MLRFLSIRRLAVIDAVEVEFGPGLNVLSGETGAGKSILVEAVGLLLGGRASGDLVRTGEESATIEAIFQTGGDELLVRREVTAQGRSRAFVNGDLATAGALKDLSARLIELHGQHEHHTLLDPSTHLATLDAFGGLDRLSAPVAAAFEEVRTLAAALADAVHAAAQRDARQELLAFQLAELDRARVTAGEDEQLAEARQVLASAERVERLCTESYAALYESDEAVLARLGGIWRRVGELAALDRQFQPYLEARDAIKPQLEDLALFLRRYADGIEASPARLQQIEERLALLERLKRKYGPTLADVMARHDRLRRDLDELDRSGQRLEELERDHDAASARYLEAAARLSEARRAAAPDFARQLEGLLGRARHGTDPVPGAFQCRSPARIGLDGEWRRHGGVLRLAESRRGSPAARPDRLRRRAVSHHARDQDADCDHAAWVQRRRRPAAGRGGAGAGVRRSRCRHRRAGGRCRRPEAPRARVGVSGPVHHAPAADCRVRRRPLSDREAGRWRADGDAGGPAR